MKAKFINESLNEYKNRVKRNTRKRLGEEPGLHLSPEETDKYMDRYEDAHGVPMRSKKMAKDVASSAFNDRGEVMNDVFEFGDDLAGVIKDMGYDADMTGVGRTEHSMPSVAMEINGKEYHFFLDENRELYTSKRGRKTHLGDWSDNLVDTRKEIKRLLSESVNEYSNPWVKTDKGGKALLDYEAKVLDVLIGTMGEDEAFASMEIPFVGEMLAKAAQRRKSPERFARQVMRMADEEWTRNGEK